jgi:hypothetical protein
MRTRAIVLWVTLSLVLPSTAPADPQGAAPHVWRGKYIEGDGAWELGARLAVVLGEEILLREAKGGGTELAIPARAVRGVLYDNKVWHGSSNVWKVIEWSAEEGHFGDDYFSQMAMITTVLGGVVILPLAHAIAGKHHFVHLQWREGNAEKLLVLQLDASERAAFLAELARLAGAAWVDLPRQREQFRRELEREKRHGLTVELDRIVRLGEDELWPGRYRMVLLPRGPDRAEAFFFRGRVRHDKVLAAAAVEVVPGPTGGTGVEVYYRGRGRDRADTLALILTSNRTLRFTVQPTLPASIFP